MFCERRGLHIKPNEDCRYCALWECGRHPKHVDEATVRHILSKCPTTERPKRGRKPEPADPITWDGKKTTCRRWRWFKGNMPDNDACERCTIPRTCPHRSEWGDVTINTELKLREKRVEKKAEERPGIYQVSYWKAGGHRFVLGGFPADNRSHPILKLLKERGFKVGRFRCVPGQPQYEKLWEVWRQRLDGTEKEFLQYSGTKNGRHVEAFARRTAGEWEIKYKRVPLPNDPAWTKAGGYEKEVPPDIWTSESRKRYRECKEREKTEK